MASAVSASNALSSAQLSWQQQLRVQQAQRNAQQAEAEARALQNQADQARRIADRAEEHARTLEMKSDQAQQNAGRARLGLAALKSADQMQDRLMRGLDRLAEAQAANPRSLTPPASEMPIVRPTINAQGQMTGTLLSVAV